jgi:hypothetical protein
MNNIPYGETVITQAELADVECWNLSDKRFDIPAGTRLRVEYVGGPSITVCAMVDMRDIPTPHPKNRLAYRFCVDNLQLGRALGKEFPATTPDLVGDLIAYESGEMDEARSNEFLKELKEAGLAGRLRGHYGRVSSC